MSNTLGTQSSQSYQLHWVLHIRVLFTMKIARMPLTVQYSIFPFTDQSSLATCPESIEKRKINCCNKAGRNLRFDFNPFYVLNHMLQCKTCSCYLCVLISNRASVSSKETPFVSGRNFARIHETGNNNLHKFYINMSSVTRHVAKCI